MSEQLETIKCVDWTINFPGAAGGGADDGGRGREGPSVETGGPPIFFIRSAPVWLRPGRPRHHPSVPVKLQVYYATNWP